jgi:hypothetical protein
LDVVTEPRLHHILHTLARSTIIDRFSVTDILILYLSYMLSSRCHIHQIDVAAMPVFSRLLRTFQQTTEQVEDILFFLTIHFSNVEIIKLKEKSLNSKS